MRLLLLSDYTALCQAFRDEGKRYACLDLQQLSPQTHPLALPDFDFVLVSPLEQDGEIACQVDQQRLAFWQQQLPAIIHLCRLRNSALLLLSSDQVFTHQPQPVSEQDSPDALSSMAQALIDMEIMAASLPRSVILRTTPLLSATPAGGLDQLSRLLREQQPLPENRPYRGLTPLDDLARVLLSLALQLDANANRWGLFHYSGINPLWLHQLLARIAEYRGYPLLAAPEEQPLPAGLPVRHLMESFGIHPRPWAERLPALLDVLP